MALIKITSFAGVSPKTPARYLQESQAQTALNCPAFSGSLQPLRGLGSTLLTLPKTLPPKTIYRFGQDTPSDTNYWFHWPVDVDVCRSQVSGDTSEWTFYTGDGTPKATFNAIALSGANYPFVSRPLGLPAPDTVMTATVLEEAAEAHPAEVVISKAQLESITAADGIWWSITDTDSYANVALADNTKETVQAALDAVEGINASIADDTVVVKTDATGETAKLYLKFVAGEVYDETSPFVYSGYDSGEKTGTANTDASLVITDTEIGSIASGDKIFLSTEDAVLINDVAVVTTHTAASLAAWLLANAPANALSITAVGSCVLLAPSGQATGVDGKITFKRKVGTNYVTTLEGVASESAGPASIVISPTVLASFDDGHVSLVVNGTESHVFVMDGATVSSLSGLSGYGVTVTTYGAVDPFAVVRTSTVGTLSTLRLRAGSYTAVDQFAYLKGEGSVDQDAVKETRVYTYTYVNSESGFTFESAPAAPAASVDVLPGGKVSLSGMAVAPGGEYVATHKRIYRSTAGTYLYVGEIPVSQAAYTDETKAEDLGEEMPSLTWDKPPDDLVGLINLPNGMMAGFVGRDVYFSEPYRPFAWPVGYSQTVDYPIVGLGRMDTTLVVLTTGAPYFMQGGHPASISVVKADMEQACVSKRSIVSFGGAVVYASPDGLVMVSPGGSRVMTDAMFTRDQWQSLNPSSMHCYQHDRKLHVFFDNGTDLKGFIFDGTSGVFIFHDIAAACCYADMQTDKLYVALPDKTLKVWDTGTAKTMTWKSKKFTLPKPMSFSFGQLEAEAYNMTVKFYADGTLVHTQTVTGRNPFRLPAKVGRDWEIQIEGSNEVFSFSMAQSGEELANG